MNISIVTIVFLASLVCVMTNNDRQEKHLNFNKYNPGNNLNFEHVISLWNKSAAVDEKENQESKDKVAEIPTVSEPAHQFEVLVQRPPTILESFSDGFKYCIRLHEKLHTLTPGNKNDQNIIIKCFKTELIANLNRLFLNSDSNIKFFNGYLELEKLNEGKQSNEYVPHRKIYSSKVANRGDGSETLVPVPLKVSRINRNHESDYYESYQKMLKELVARKNGQKREKREAYDNSTRSEDISNTETLQKTARLFESGRKLYSEISRNLQNEEEDIENLTETILDPDLLTSLNRFTRQYVLKVNLYPGITAKMMRNSSNGVTFDLELNESDKDDEDDAEEKLGGNHGGRGDDIKKKKKKLKISKKTLKKLFPYLLIPFMIQAALLPLVLKFLLFVAIKALIAGKLALVLVAFNVLKHGGHRSDDDEYVERMTNAHYGYNEGEEYGAWVNNRRTLVLPTIERGRSMNNEPYRGYKPQQPTS